MNEVRAVDSVVVVVLDVEEEEGPKRVGDGC